LNTSVRAGFDAGDRCIERLVVGQYHHRPGRAFPAESGHGFLGNARQASQVHEYKLRGNVRGWPHGLGRKDRLARSVARPPEETCNLRNSARPFTHQRYGRFGHGIPFIIWYIS
jgi:hypothetical protein